ncbi:hypothetical protein MICAC_2020002 [Microcystis aeruginosa PCC 9443]|uniref:Four helix bundle protein n=1 Tax=Microcystis aeruginosa PCC 9443 TaxID=1160281 RepID=I4G0H9_MICAE|nr:hypothetical protein MICAC_2020002 [Microcystis aeruginosa PCC 9443]
MESKVYQKADQFVIRIVNAYKYLSPEKKEFLGTFSLKIR